MINIILIFRTIIVIIIVIFIIIIQVIWILRLSKM